MKKFYLFMGLFFTVIYLLIFIFSGFVVGDGINNFYSVFLYTPMLGMLAFFILYEYKVKK